MVAVDYLIITLLFKYKLSWLIEMKQNGYSGAVEGARHQRALSFIRPRPKSQVGFHQERHLV